MRSAFISPSRWLALSILAVALMAAPAANAAMISIDVLVEDSDNPGDFISVGIIQSFDNSGDTAGDSYNYSNFSYGGSDITPEDDESQIFFVMNSNGLNLFWVHDSTDFDGGSADTTLSLMDPLGSTGPLNQLVVDEANDTYSGFGTDTVNAVQDWIDAPSATAAGFTDGLATGNLNMTVGSGWMLFANFNDVSGLDSWMATSATGDKIDLSSYLANSGDPEAGLRVKFQVSQTEIPEPGTVALLGLGLAGLVGLRRRKQ